MVSGTLTVLREYPHVRLEQELYDRRQIFDEQNYKFYHDREVENWISALKLISIPRKLYSN
jgi:hypothetical protein